MQHCRCSIRALELFVKDFAALNIRTSQGQQARRFATRPARRKHEITSAKRQEPAHVPFDIESRSRKQLFDSRAVNGGNPKGVSHGTGGGFEEPAEWHAELELVEPEDAESAMLEGQATASNEGPEEQKSQATSSVDSVAFPRLWRTSEPTRLAVKIPEMQDITPAPVQPPERSTDSRKERKARRTMEGTFRPLARQAEAAKPRKQDQKSAPEQEEVQDQMTSVLENLKAMEGIGELQPPKVRKERKPRSETGRNAPKARKEDDAAKSTQMTPKVKRERWQIQKDALQSKLGDQAWNPRKRLSPDTLDGIRALHASNPNAYDTETLSQHFKVTPENIRRILKSKWRPNEQEMEERRARWEKRGVKKWSEMAELGVRPPRQWREMGIGSVKGEPDEKPAWKKGGRRRGDDVGWGNESTTTSRQEEQGLAERIV